MIRFDLRRKLTAWGCAGAWLCSTALASAQSIIEQGSSSHDYRVEIEPHGVFSPFDPPRSAADAGLGGGLLVGFNLAPAGFLPMVNDSAALVVGADFVHYFGGPVRASECAEYSGSGAARICVRTRSGSGPANYLFVPAALQWNFYFTDEWSAFAEAGVGTYFGWSRYQSGLRAGVIPVFNVGGRYAFSETFFATVRMGYPYFSAGVSLRF